MEFSVGHIFTGILAVGLTLLFAHILSGLSDGKVGSYWNWFGWGNARIDFEFGLMTWGLLLFAVLVIGCLVLDPGLFARLLNQ